jgi:hypothetical protein
MSIFLLDFEYVLLLVGVIIQEVWVYLMIIINKCYLLKQNNESASPASKVMYLEL